jgi:hypothetical protein
MSTVLPPELKKDGAHGFYGLWVSRPKGDKNIIEIDE